MRASSEWNSRAVGLLLASGFLSGCSVSKCPDEPDGGSKSNCAQIQLDSRYQITHATSGSAAWSSGQNVSIAHALGDIRLIPDGASATLSVNATAFALAPGDESGKALANQQMSQLILTVTPSSNAIAIADNGASKHGYDLDVHIPPAFDATLDLQTGAGHIIIVGVGQALATRAKSSAGGITALALVGAIDLRVSAGDIVLAGTPSGAGSVAITESGTVTAVLLPSTNITVSASGNPGLVELPASLPADWALALPETDGGVSAASLRIGAGAQGDLTLRGSSLLGSAVVLRAACDRDACNASKL